MVYDGVDNVNFNVVITKLISAIAIAKRAKTSVRRAKRQSNISQTASARDRKKNGKMLKGFTKADSELS